MIWIAFYTEHLLSECPGNLQTLAVWQEKDAGNSGSWLMFYINRAVANISAIFFRLSSMLIYKEIYRIFKWNSWKEKLWLWANRPIFYDLLFAFEPFRNKLILSQNTKYEYMLTESVLFSFITSSQQNFLNIYIIRHEHFNGISTCQMYSISECG